jgi:hypothetical protein
VATASVSITVLQQDCTDALDGAEATTDPDGGYRERVRTASEPFTACLRVEVREAGVPPTSAGIVVEGVHVNFLPDYGEDQQRDSVRVDVELPSPVP